MNATMVRRRTASAAQFVIAAFVVGLLISGCGGGSSSSTDQGDDRDTSAVSTDEAVESAKKELNKYYAGVFGEPPTSGPKPEPGKSIWIVPCGVQAPGCLAEAEGAEEAAKELGWNYRVVDGKLSPAVYNQVIRQATAAQIDGLALIGINCSDAPSAIKSAVDAGVKIAADVGEDCPGGGFSTYPVYFNGKNNLEIIAIDDSRARVAWLVAELDGKANPLIIYLSDNNISTAYADGLKQALRQQCPECEAIDAGVTVADLLEGKIQGKIETLLVQHPEANAIVTADDVEWSGGGSAAVQGSGRDLLSVNAEGLDQTIDEIRNGDLDASGVLFFGWSGWSLIDSLNRAFAGETGAVPSGNGYMLVDQEHGLPPEGKSLSQEGPLTYDWKAPYRESWQLPAR